MAPPKGFGPLTDWLTASRSTGLSHGGTFMLCYHSVLKRVFKFSRLVEAFDLLFGFAFGVPGEEFVGTFESGVVPFAVVCHV